MNNGQDPPPLPVKIDSHMTKKECVLAVCRIVGFTLSEESLKKLDEMDKKRKAKKAQSLTSKPKVARAKAGGAKFKSPKHKKATRNKTEEAKDALIKSCTPSQIRAAQKSATSDDDFYKNLLAFKSPQADGSNTGS